MKFRGLGQTGTRVSPFGLGVARAVLGPPQPKHLDDLLAGAESPRPTTSSTRSTSSFRPAPALARSTMRTRPLPCRTASSVAARSTNGRPPQATPTRVLPDTQTSHAGGWAGLGNGSR